MKRVRPIIMFPFVLPRDLTSITLLYQVLAGLSEADFYRPVTIVNNQTRYRSMPPASDDSEVAQVYTRAVEEIIRPASEVVHTWAVDSCSMWLRGLGDAFEASEDGKTYQDVYWIIPGDFNFSTQEGSQALAQLPKIPEKVLAKNCNISLGEVEVPLNSAKQLIDTYGTYGLLYNWFPAEAKGIRNITDKPRTEFFAIDYDTLRQALIPSRWYAYEQTLVILLQNMDGERAVRPIRKVRLGRIEDEEATRSTLAAAMQQVERTERVLKLFWRERAQNRGRPNWQDEFRILDAQSESIRSSAMVILRRVLL